tara:strand:- start:8683 stop:8835 length:153 start_codon:yes stop_codon:yes gene_type:complete
MVSERISSRSVKNGIAYFAKGSKFSRFADWSFSRPRIQEEEAVMILVDEI